MSEPSQRNGHYDAISVLRTASVHRQFQLEPQLVSLICFLDQSILVLCRQMATLDTYGRMVRTGPTCSMKTKLMVSGWPRIGICPIMLEIQAASSLK